MADGAILVTARQVATRLGVEVETVRRWARKGAIGSVRVGPFRLLRFRESDVAAAIAESQADAHGVLSCDMATDPDRTLLTRPTGLPRCSGGDPRA